MRIAFTAHAHEQYTALPSPIQAKFDKQLRFLLADLRHPSLRAKKYDESRNLWQARVDRNYRFYFQVQGDTYTLLSIIPHPK